MPAQDDRNLRATFKVFVDDAGILNLVYFQSTEDSKNNARVAELISQEISEILDKSPQQTFNSLIDLLSLGKKGNLSSRSRKTYARLMSHKQLAKIALVGKSTFLKVAIGFIAQAVDKRSALRYFSNKKEALQWLK